jgi:hypothetical protein
MRFILNNTVPNHLQLIWGMGGDKKTRWYLKAHGKSVLQDLVGSIWGHLDQVRVCRMSLYVLKFDTLLYTQSPFLRVLAIITGFYTFRIMNFTCKFDEVNKRFGGISGVGATSALRLHAHRCNTSLTVMKVSALHYCASESNDRQTDQSLLLAYVCCHLCVV